MCGRGGDVDADEEVEEEEVEAAEVVEEEAPPRLLQACG
eukprot:CAMPEP_0175030248 /NCGR_PEP_ID=MMETSP0005-20121125/20107_1 /TAXON_ID=420556 /ORGANISM="Ochromonas sp., Strain CCMP1393" /LENGTH=38 /DNA_ID= /DNA_START= /DNA_END= /DNA_ORIENTATION=